jgi:hypothetical protein
MLKYRKMLNELKAQKEKYDKLKQWMTKNRPFIDTMKDADE